MGMAAVKKAGADDKPSVCHDKPSMDSSKSLFFFPTAVVGKKILSGYFQYNTMQNPNGISTIYREPTDPENSWKYLTSSSGGTYSFSYDPVNNKLPSPGGQPSRVFSAIFVYEE